MNDTENIYAYYDDFFLSLLCHLVLTDYCLPSFPQETGKEKINTIVFYISH